MKSSETKNTVKAICGFLIVGYIGDKIQILSYKPSS